MGVLQVRKRFEGRAIEKNLVYSRLERLNLPMVYCVALYTERCVCVCARACVRACVCVRARVRAEYDKGDSQEDCVCARAHVLMKHAYGAAITNASSRSWARGSTERARARKKSDGVACTVISLAPACNAGMREGPEAGVEERFV